MTKSFWCHPDNERILAGSLTTTNSAGDITQNMRELVKAMRIQTNPHLEKDKPTGRIVCPDGKVLDRKGFSWKWDRFTTLEESDLRWAIPLGIVREEVQPVFFMIDEPQMDFQIKMRDSFAPVDNRRLLISGGF